jgi:hypothetical protein
MPYKKYLGSSPKHWPSRLNLWRLGCLLLLTCLSLAGCQGATDTPFNIGQSSPEAAVRTLYDALQRGDVEAYRTVLDADDPHSGELVYGFEKALAAGYSFEAEDLEVQIVREETEAARVRTYFSQKILFKGQVVDDTQLTGDVIDLVKRGDKWFVQAFGRDAWLDEPSQ